MENIMSKQMLHIRNPGRLDNVAAIIGDRRALEALQRAVDTALATGAGGAFLFSSDGEGYALAVAMEDNMEVVQTAYAGETMPDRSLRERVPMYAARNFGVALRKALLQSGESHSRPSHKPSAANLGNRRGT
jgi:hypothetical protein